MNKEWSELNKTMQQQIKKHDTYNEGIDTNALVQALDYAYRVLPAYHE